VLEFNPQDYGRPWLEGVAVVVNLVGDARFNVTGSSPEEVAEAARVVQRHDGLHRVDIVERMLAKDGQPLARRDGADWIAGVEDAMCALADAITSAGAGISPFSVAITGIPVTRNEPDGKADVEAVSALVRDGLGLSVSSCWPSSCVVADLAAVCRSGIIVALPNGLRVAAAIAARTGARVVQAPIPLGFDNTSRFVGIVASACGRRERGAEFVNAELGRIVPRFEWVVPHSLLNRRIGLVGDASMIQAAAGFLQEVGCVPCRGAVTGSGDCAVDLSAIFDDDPGEPMALTIGNSNFTKFAATTDEPFLEAWFPCQDHHSFFPKPQFGFDGAAAFLQDIVNRMAFFEIMSSWKNTVINEEDR